MLTAWLLLKFDYHCYCWNKKIHNDQIYTGLHAQVKQNYKKNGSGCCIEWMMHLYSALLCIVVYPKHFTIVGGGGGGLSSTTTSVQHPLGWCDGCHRTAAPVRSPHTSYRWRRERVIEPIKWMGIIRRPWLTRASGGNFARTPGLHPYSLREVPWDF